MFAAMKSSFRSSVLLTLLLAFGPMFSVPRVEAAASYQRSLLRLHNKERIKRNRKPLRLHGALNRAAVKYAKVMSDNDHFDHTGPAPDFTTFDERIKAECPTCFTTMGENIALGQKTPAEVTKAWMRSPGHRRNILYGRFKSVGFGKAGAEPYWSTSFGG